MKIITHHKVSINLSDQEIDDFVRILHMAYEKFSGKNAIGNGIKTPYTEDARTAARSLIRAIYAELPCSYSKPALSDF